MTTCLEQENANRKAWHLRRGVTVRSTVDCLIAQLAVENGVMILARDRDVRLILEFGLCDVRPVPLAGGPES